MIGVIVTLGRCIVSGHILTNKLYNGCWKTKKYIVEKYYKYRNYLRLNSTGVIYENDIITSGKLVISNLGEIKIGKGVVINSSYYPNPVATYPSRIYTENDNARISIGDGTGMSNVFIFCVSSITIGKNVLIGAGTKIVDTDFHGLDFYENKNGETYRTQAQSKSINIGDDVFIGMDCLILKGVYIGNRSVVGARSVVTKDIPDGEIWAGNPARFIRKVSTFLDE